MTIELAPPHGDLTFMSPLSEARADAIVAFLADGFRGTVLDIGCGWAELLLRVVAAAPEGRGVGVDLDAAAIAHGGELARQRRIDDRVTLIVDDARAFSGGADAVICIGASEVWGPPVEENQAIDYAAALNAVRALVPTGGRVLYGEGVWSRPPTAEAAAGLGGRLDEFIPLADLADLAAQSGYAVVATHEANLDEWDAFESGYCAAYARWLVDHGPDHPDAAEVRSRARAQRDRYLRGYRGILGLAYLHLVAV